MTTANQPRQDQPGQNQPRQLRLIIETDDFDGALRFYRDALGMPEQAAFATEGDDRVAILQAGIATIELATPTHVTNIDEIERVPSGTERAPRIALQVDDTASAVHAAEAAGLSSIGPVTRTPFRSLNARIHGPAGWQITFFQELEPIEVRQTRDGFAVDEERARP